MPKPTPQQLQAFQRNLDALTPLAAAIAERPQIREELRLLVQVQLMEAGGADKLLRRLEDEYPPPAPAPAPAPAPIGAFPTLPAGLTAVPKGT